MIFTFKHIIITELGGCHAFRDQQTHIFIRILMLMAAARVRRVEEERERGELSSQLINDGR